MKNILIALVMGIATLFAGVELAEASNCGVYRTSVTDQYSHRNDRYFNTVSTYNNSRSRTIYPNHNRFDSFQRNDYRDNNFNNFNRYDSRQWGHVTARRFVRVVDLRTNRYHNITFERVDGFGWTQRVFVRDSHGRFVYRNVVVRDLNTIIGLNNRVTSFRGYFAHNGIFTSVRRNFRY